MCAFGCVKKNNNTKCSDSGVYNNVLQWKCMIMITNAEHQTKNYELVYRYGSETKTYDINWNNNNTNDPILYEKNKYKYNVLNVEKQQQQILN